MFFLVNLLTMAIFSIIFLHSNFTMLRGAQLSILLWSKDLYKSNFKVIYFFQVVHGFYFVFQN